MAIPVYERQHSLAALPGARVSASENAGGMAVARALGGLASDFREMNDRFEDARISEALNNFQRDVNDYHLDPEKGIFATRRGGNAHGMEIGRAHV